MALSRRTGQRFQASIWPGFVDAMTGLLLVLMFVLTIFMVMQFVLRETITAQDSELSTLSSEISALADALGLERDQSALLLSEVGALSATLQEAQQTASQQEALIAALQADNAGQERALEAANSQIVDFEERVAGLLVEQAQDRGRIADLDTERDDLQTALAGARSEMDAQAEAARLAAARREALQALVADLRAENAQTAAALSNEEAARLVEAEAAAALRNRLENADAELTAMTLALEQQRTQAEETLTLLAASQRAGEDLNARLAEALVSGEEAQAALVDRATQLSALESQLAQALARATLEQDTSAERIAALEAELQAVRAASEARTAQDGAAQDALAARLSDALAQLEARVADVAGLREGLSGAQADRAALAAELAETRAALSVADMARGDLQVDRDTLAADLAARDAALADLRAQLTETQDGASAQVSALEADLASLQAEMRRTLGLLAAAEEGRRADRDTLSVDLATRDAELARLRAELAQTRDDGAVQVADLQTDLAALRDTAEALRARLLSTQVQASDGQEQAAQLALDKATLEQALERALAAAATLETRLDTAEMALAAARAELATAQSQAEDDTRSLEERLAAALAAQVTTNSDAQAVRDRLASALAEQRAAEQAANAALSAAEERAALLATARDALSEEQARADRAVLNTTVLNQQIAALRSQLQNLQGLLDDSQASDLAAQVQLQTLGADLNAALAKVAAEERRRRLEIEARSQDLERYRSEFFGRLRDVLGGQEGVRIEGDRFVFSSEVLFPPGGASLSREGQGEIAKIADILRDVSGDIPEGIDWVIRVDGHTDDVPLSGLGEFSDNWELSQARALSVVKYMVAFLGIPPDRLSANGFGQYQPINPDDTAEARAQNRRIELKFTEK